MCRLRLNSFGLSNEYMKSVYEQFFQLKYFGSWSLIEAYNLPIGLRKWFYERLAKQINDENKAKEDASNKSRGNRTLPGPRNTSSR